MRRALEIFAAVTATVVVVVAALTGDAPSWLVVIAFGALVMLAENTVVFVHASTAISPSFMIMMAAIAVFGPSDGVLGAALVGACGGLYLPHIRSRRFGILAFNCGQYALSSTAAAAVYYAAFANPGGLMQLLAAGCAALAFGAVNVSLVLPYAAKTAGERAGVVWADMYRALPNYLSWGMLGLLVGLVCDELGALAIVLLAVPMGIGRWTFRSFSRVKEAHDASLHLFIRLIEAKDPYTAGHTERVAKYTTYIGEELGLAPSRLEHLRQSALMHDIGKLAVPGRLLNKPGRLTQEEWDVVKRHNTAGIDILANIDFMRTMAVAASDAHGRFDRGAGSMPADLLLEAHIVAVADAFDAMTSTRSYRRALSQAIAYEELRANAGSQFNPECVEALIVAIERRGEQFGAGHEVDAHEFETPPPVTGVGSAGLGDLEATP